jgi:PKD repeat protein
VSHIYSEKGTYNVTLIIVDDDGAISQTSIIIIVEEIPPQKVEDRKELAKVWGAIGGTVTIVVILTIIVVMIRKCGIKSMKNKMKAK